MDQINETGHDEMLNCPKCGFQQPRDQYCAKCGVDMVKAALARPKSSPLVIMGTVIAISGLGIFAYTKFAAKPASNSGSAQLASSTQRSAKEHSPTPPEPTAHDTNERHSTDHASETASPESTHADSAHPYDSHDDEMAGSSHGTEKNFEATSQLTAQLAARGKSASQHSPTQHSLKGQASAEVRKQLEQSATSITTQEEGVLVAFAWAEMSKELLQSLQAAEPGFHQVPGLEARLRQARGGYQILEVVRRRMKDDSEAVTLAKGELSLYFEPMKIGTKEFVGGYTAQYRSAQGELRSPASATASIAPGAGAIVTMGPSSTTPTNGVVVLIMPRW